MTAAMASMRSFLSRSERLRPSDRTARSAITEVRRSSRYSTAIPDAEASFVPKSRTVCVHGVSSPLRSSGSPTTTVAASCSAAMRAICATGARLPGRRSRVGSGRATVAGPVEVRVDEQSREWPGESRSGIADGEADAALAEIDRENAPQPYPSRVATRASTLVCSDAFSCRCNSVSGAPIMNRHRVSPFERHSIS